MRSISFWKRIFLVSLLGLLFLPASQPASAGMRVWSSYRMAPVAVTALAVDPVMPTTLYAGTSSGMIYKSIDAGGQWQVVRPGVDGSGINALVIDPNDPDLVYAATNAGVIKSGDGGLTWLPAGMAGLVVLDLVMSPADANTLYAGTGSADPLWKTTDGGKRWEVVYARPTADGHPVFSFFSALDIMPSAPETLYLGTVFCLSHGCINTINKSSDGGVSWQDVPVPWQLWRTFENINVLVVDPLNPSILYTGNTCFDTSGMMIERCLFKSSDGGENWQAILKGSLIQSMAIHPANPAILFAGSSGEGVWMSTNAGESWAAVLPDVSIGALEIAPPYLYMGGDSGVFVYQVPPATLTTNFDVGAPGSFFSINGQNFSAGQPADLRINGHWITDRLLVDDQGNVSFHLDSSQAEAGLYVITVSSGWRRQVILKLAPDAPLHPLTGQGALYPIPAGIGMDQVIYIPLVGK